MSDTESEYVCVVGDRRNGVTVYRVGVPGGYLYITMFNQMLSSCFVPVLSAPPEDFELTRENK